MIFFVPKSVLILSLGIAFAVADAPGPKRHAARFDASGLTSNSTAHGHVHSLGEIRPIKEGEATKPDPAAHGHLYTPGLNRPVFGHPTESTSESTTESKILAARITTTEVVTVTNIPLVFTTVTITRSYSHSSPASSPLPSTAAAVSEVSGLPDYRSITITLTEQSTVPPPFETLTDPRVTLPSCNGPAAASGLTPVGCTVASSAAPYSTKTYNRADSSQGSSWHVHAVTTSQPLPLTSNSTPCAGNGSFECVVNGSKTITLGPISQLFGTGPHPTSGASISGTENHSQSWTSNSTPCAQNNSFECVVNGSNTITLGLISEILGAATGKPTNGVSVSVSGNYSQNWTSHSTPCVDNKSFECVYTGSRTITIGPIASLNHLRPWTSNSTPCAQNNSFECVVNGSSTITLGLIASMTASQPSTMSTDKGLLSTLSNIASILTTSPHTTITASTKLQIAPSITTSTGSRGGLPQSAAPSMMDGPTPCVSNTSLECLVQGTRTFVVGTLGLPAQTPTPVSRTLVPCAQNTVLSCLIDGSHTLTIPVLPSTISMIPCPQDNLSSCVVEGSRTLTVPPRPTNITIRSSFSTVSGSQAPHDPYPYPRASNSGRKANVPTFLLLLCSLVSIVTAQGIYGGSKGGNPSSTSTDINYGPLVSSLNGLASSASGEPDGNWIGAPPATTPAPPNSPYASKSASSIATEFTAPQNPTFGGGGGGTKATAAAPTHADSGSGSWTTSAFPTNFIVPVTGSGTEAPLEPSVETSSQPVASVQPVASKNVTSRASNIKIPLLLLLICSFVSMTIAKITPAPRGAVQASLCPCQTDMSIGEGVDGITMTGGHRQLASSDSSTSASPSTLVVTTHPVSLLSSLYNTSNHSPTIASTTKTATASQGLVSGSCASNTSLDCILQGFNTFTVGTLAPQTTLKTTTSSPPTISKSATSGSSKMKIPFFFLLLIHWVPLTAGVITSPSPSALIGSVLTLASAPSPTSTPLPSSIQTRPTMVVTTETFTRGHQSIVVTISGAGPCALGTGAGCIVQSNGTASLPTGPTPTLCASNTDLMCIVQGSSTFTVGTVEPTTTLTSTPALVAATTGFLTPSPSPSPSPSKPANSGASSNLKLPLFISFLGNLISVVKSAAASNFPIPSGYAGAGNMNVHRETASQGYRSFTTPFLVVFLGCAIATLYSLSTGRKNVKHVQNTRCDSGLAVQRGECVQAAPEGEKVH